MSTTQKIDDLSEKIKVAFGGLLKDADQISKKVLNVFDPSKDSDVNISKLARVNRGELETLAEYLKVPLVNSDMKKLYNTRSKLARRIVLEIKSLYPSVCSECTVEYTVMPGNQPKYRCWICLQGAHNCEAFTGKMEIYTSQPSQLTGLVWLCFDCLAVNKCSGDNDDSNPSGFGTPIPNDESVSSQNDSSSKDLDKQNIQQLQQKLEPKLEAAKKEQELSESKPNTCKHVCPRLIKGTCPHGISGKKTADGKEKCDLFHPKRCTRYMRYYTHETKGCNEGENCAYLHVNLCNSSVETKKCKDINCRSMHLSGTKRPKSMLKKKKDAPSEKTPNDPQPSAQETKRAKPKPVRKGANERRKPTNEGPTKEVSFLEIKSLLDTMNTKFIGEMTSLRTEMDLCKQQLETLMTSNPHSAHSRPMAQYGLYKPTPYGMPQQCQQLCQQTPSQTAYYPPGITPIPHACF